MKPFSFALLASAVLIGCSADDSAPTNAGKGGAATAGSGGKGGSSLGGAGGSVGTAGSTGAAGAAGRAGSGGNGGGGAAGTGGAAGAAGTGGAAGAGGGDVDASIDGSANDGADATNEVDAGFPEASTCAGYALDLDGFSAYGTVNRMVQDDFTLEAWIKAAGPSFTGPNFWQGSPIIYADTAGNNNDFGTSVINNHFAMGIGVPGAAEPTIEGLTDVTTGQWYHVAATRRESTGELQVYVYGQLETSVVTTNHNPLNAQALISFGGNTIDGRYFHGALDEIRIWNVVRTPAELQSNMHTRLAGNEPGLVGYWRFDEPGVASAVDSSPNLANAALMGAVNWVPSDAPVCGARRDAGAPDVGPNDAAAPDARPDVSTD